MQFKDFRTIQQIHLNSMFKNNNILFTTDIDKDTLWKTYLDSFPKGTNDIFRERREHDCSCCRHFIKQFGNVVSIEKGKMVTIWDFVVNDSTYNPVITALSKLVKTSNICDIFTANESSFGTVSNMEQLEDGSVHTWYHFRVDLPNKFVNSSVTTSATIIGRARDVRNVFKRSLEEISQDSIETTLDLIAQKSLYKGEEWSSILTQFLKLHKEYAALTAKNKELYCWSKSAEVGGTIGKIKNHSIGVLLTDITIGINLDKAVKRYESIVAPTNYKRPKAIYTKKMIETAKQTITDMGFLESLNRRHAVIEDITINNVLFANKDAIKKMGGDVFDDMSKEICANPKSFKNVEKISIENFMKDVLPRTTSIEILFENKLVSNLMSLIAPKNKDSKSMFKWNNNFSWAYNGNITDSIKENVKSAGGAVDGFLRFSIQWNDETDYNSNDFDAHCRTPDERHIYYANKGTNPFGVLDVDIIYPQEGKVAVENITWPEKKNLKEGIYKFYVNCYSYRGGKSGFKAQIEYNGQIYEYNYDSALRQSEDVLVAELRFNKEKGITFIKSLDSQLSSRTAWNLKTNQLYPVSTLMYSPNYWDKQNGIGNRHYFFMINDCINSTAPNGFFNEFLKEELMEHKKVFEMIGSKMSVKTSDNQLSGIGFSSTKRNSIMCKIKGHVDRMLEITF